jgi:hypothetical protein
MVILAQGMPWLLVAMTIDKGKNQKIWEMN